MSRLPFNDSGCLGQLGNAFLVSAIVFIVTAVLGQLTTLGMIAAPFYTLFTFAFMVAPTKKNAWESKVEPIQGTKVGCLLLFVALSFPFCNHLAVRQQKAKERHQQFLRQGAPSSHHHQPSSHGHR